MANKYPFERITSLLDRKKILKSLAEGSELYLKHNDGSLSTLKLRGLDEDHNVIGDWMTDNAHAPLKGLVAFFYLNKDRYFIKTQMKAVGHSWLLINNSQFYKLNRRNHYRIEIPPSINMTLHIQSVRNTDFGETVRVLNFSAGGLRILWPSKFEVGSGTPLRGILQWDDEKMMPVEAQVIHALAKNEYGIKFIKLSSAAQNRLKMWAIELQQVALFE